MREESLWMGLVLLIKGSKEISASSVLWGYNNKSVTQKCHAGTLNLDVQPPHLWAIKLCCLKVTQCMVFCNSSLQELRHFDLRQCRTVLSERREGLIVLPYCLEHFLDQSVGGRIQAECDSLTELRKQNLEFGEANTTNFRGRVSEKEDQNSALVFSWVSCPGLVWSSVKPGKKMTRVCVNSVKYWKIYRVHSVVGETSFNQSRVDPGHWWETLEVMPMVRLKQLYNKGYSKLALKV